MKKATLLVCLLESTGLSAWSYAVYQDPIFEKSWGMQIFSPAFSENARIPGKYTCDGVNVSPPLHIRGVSSVARSLVLIVEDPDAIREDWVHWTVWNMDATTRVIAENAIPEGSVEGDTDFELPAWFGPCPRMGEHRYIFRLYALDVKLELPLRATKEELEKAMRGHILDQSSLVGLYGRTPASVQIDAWIYRKSTN